ncbi:MAG: 4-hydroxy-2-oxovalerate aldolase [SAR324 cluster bacterium]|nr:4-hydroxy-2-oxovalerate aldolase [SAR324 cluster bacterium]
MNLTTRRQQLKSKLRQREPVFACWTSLGHASITEMFARSGVDFIGIDIEHSTISQEQSQRIIAAAQANETLCLPRIASHNAEMIKRLLDSGADGLIVPMVSTPEEAKNLINWTKYSPRGNRSFGIARGQGYGFDFETYTSQWNECSSLIVQIESIEGVKNIESILAFEDIDGAMIGPYDLSGSLGIPGQLQHPKIVEAAQKVMAACKKYGKACGTQLIEPDQLQLQKALDDGYTFIVLASDIFLLWKWSARMKTHIDALRQS